MVVRRHAFTGRFGPEPLAEAVSGRVSHVPPELGRDLVQKVAEHLGGLTFLIEQSGLGEEGDEGLRL
jgi:hypothetical protein